MPAIAAAGVGRDNLRATQAMKNLCPLGVALALLPLATLASCTSAYLATMEAFGYEKREILVERVEDGRDSQAEAQQEIQTAFERLKALTGFDGGSLGDKYEEIQTAYDRAERSARDVKGRIRAIEDVADAMFSEWQGEIEEISDAKLRSKSEKLKADTKSGYDQLLTRMQDAEKAMQPVLTALKDRVLFLKHNLNAQAIASLEESVADIEGDVQDLIDEMQRSIDEAERFLSTMSS